MSDPYVGETRIFAFTFPPEGWMRCNGQELDIGDFGDLFMVLDQTYGGNGVSTFRVPQVTGPVSGDTPLSVCISVAGALQSS